MVLTNTCLALLFSRYFNQVIVIPEANESSSLIPLRDPSLYDRGRTWEDVETKILKFLAFINKT